ncbi:MAG TPA: Gfo/Idh/MocA family oxidoreductase [Gemmatimonadaceae bacterium]|nr:Gfo/Idh/MocA family oxidoreductase [Gemmatimonadaceae bacterium]
MSVVRWGVLGVASIAVRQVIPAIKASRNGVVTAIASRDVERARASAAQLGVAAWCGSYDELLQRTDVDAVYVPLPNHLHVPWSVRALQAGKHVLCEKPIALNAPEARVLHDAARAHPGLKVMEAFMYRFHPQWVRAQSLVRDGAIGPLGTVQTFFSYFNDDAANVRNIAPMGGGALLDIGCYGISLSRLLFGREPVRVLGYMEFDPRFGTDRLTSAVLDFDGGSGTVTCATQLARHQRANIIGARGRIEIEIPFNAPGDRPCRIFLQRGGSSEEISFEACNQYTEQADRFALAVLNESPVPTSIDDAVQNMRVIDAVAKSARTGLWERP